MICPLFPPGMFGPRSCSRVGPPWAPWWRIRKCAPGNLRVCQHDDSLWLAHAMAFPPVRVRAGKDPATCPRFGVWYVCAALGNVAFLSGARKRVCGRPNPC